MAICKNCGSQFTWGSLDDRWVPLIPSGEEGNLPRTHVDADGVLHYTMLYVLVTQQQQRSLN